MSKWTMAAVVMAAGTPAFAGVILQDVGLADRQIAAFEPIGQTFKAEDVEISAIAFAFSDINAGAPNQAVTLTLYAGAGFGGAVVKSVSRLLPAVLPSPLLPPEFIDFDFTGSVLTVGGTYTIAARVAQGSPKVAVVYSGANPYAGGTSIDAGGVRTRDDLNFRVTPVPTPAALALAAAACLPRARRQAR